jgi:poly(3-hydroxybutyrate) depolymerase
MKRTIAGGALTLACALAASAAQISRIERIAGTELRFKVILPPGYDASKEYPAVLAFPGGAQNMPMVDGMIARNWRAQAEQRGYIVVVASAPAEGLFYQGGSKVFPEFLDKLLSDYKVRGGRFHIAGISNGGISAFFVAAAYPGYFYSVTGFPGYLPGLTTERASALKGLCLNLHVGELDRGWVSTMAEQADIFRARGLKVRFTIEPGQGHVMRTLENAGAARLFDQFEEAREGCR